MKLVYAATIACSSALLFAIEPIAAKALLPSFGGSAGVWVTCILFFQIVLLLGYLYAYAITRLASRKLQAAVHVILLIASAFVPVAQAAWTVHGPPVLCILAILTRWIGLPFFVLSSTSPLLQSWYARSSAARFPYRLFALSNAASLLALLAYPFVIEPLLSQREQLRYWAAAYVLFVVLALIAAVTAVRGTAQELAVDALAGRPFLWIALAACAATLWPAVASHLSQEVAAIPFLWVLPLSLYLLSFILCFESSGWYRPAVFRWLLPVALIALSARLALPRLAGGMRTEIPVFCVALFVCCMFCHGELARLKPASGLAFFYLTIALGGALGAVFVGLIAPNVFSTYLELPIGVAACVVLSLPSLYGRGSPRRLLRLCAIGVAAFVIANRYSAGSGDIMRTRNFYGALQVADSGEGDAAIRSLSNGRILHGIEFLSPARSRLATTYYGPKSGVGVALQSLHMPNRRIAVVGLGAGTVATYGRAGDIFHFYDINPAVIQVAREQFRFLRESAAKVEVTEADGRLGIQHEQPQSFDAIVLDAFSGDAIPVHLLTREAFEMYFRRMTDRGVLAIHVTNRYLDIASAIEVFAAEDGKQILLIGNGADAQNQIKDSDWVLLANGRGALTELEKYASPNPLSRKIRPWTDDYSNLFQILK